MPKSLRIKLKLPKDEVEAKKPRINLPDQVQMSFVKETEVDFGALYSKLETNIKEGMDLNTDAAWG